MRDYGRNTSGTASVAIPAFYERNPYNWPLLSEPLRFEIEASLPGPGAYISDLNYQSGSTPLGPWSTAVTDPDDLPQNSYYRFNFTMNGESAMDGDTPTVGPGSLYVVVKPFMTQLLKDDRTEIAGPVFVNGMDTPSNRPQTNILNLDGDVFATRTSKRVRYLEQPITLHIATEDAKRYLERMEPDDKLTIEAPFLRGANIKHADGRLMVIKPGQDIVVDTGLETVFIDDDDERNVYGVATIQRAQVIEYTPLQNL
jgi:hypothetical protein